MRRRAKPDRGLRGEDHRRRAVRRCSVHRENGVPDGAVRSARGGLWRGVLQNLPCRCGPPVELPY